MKADVDTMACSPEELCSRIAVLTGCIMDFWKHSSGWVPAEASELLEKSMLDWQSSLAGSLSRWLDAESDGDLILAWANLGALVEGQLKLFLCAYYLDYKSDVDAICKNGKVLDPDGCMLEQLRRFFKKRIWNTGRDWNPYVAMVQERETQFMLTVRERLGRLKIGGRR